MTRQPNRRDFLKTVGASAAAAAALHALPADAQPPAAPADRPNIVLMMTDDQGWGDTSYNNHPILKTPNLDAMAAAGLRFDRFYSACPVCSPTRGSVLTGRHPNRFACFSHGYPLRQQELTIAQLLKDAGYATGHFGKWHLNGKAGPGVPVRADDPLNPGRFGFDTWASASNFIDLDGGLGVMGKPTPYTGDSSDAIMKEAISFVRKSVQDKKPFLAVIWYGSPHNPHRALPEDTKPYADSPKGGHDYYGELTAVDRTVGQIRKELRDLGVADNTLVWFCSDNGGAQGELSTGGLRGKKSTLWEGGIRVPGIIEWPAKIRQGRIAAMPAGTVDIFPTVLEAAGVKPARIVEPLDGISLMPLVAAPLEKRDKPLCWEWNETKPRHSAITDNQYKLHKLGLGDEATYELYDIVKDPKETTDIAAAEPQVTARLKEQLNQWLASVQRSLEGKDYPEGKLTTPDPGRKRLSPEETNWRGDAPATQPAARP